jgi:hypothetical protein
MPEPIREQFIPLVERAVRRDGTIAIKMIQPGWGTSGYYSRDVLERDMPTAFPPGTHMYWNHPTLSEQAERPERDLRDLAAVTVSAPRFQEDGPAGPGVYADAKVFGGYAETIDEIAEHIGTSILGAGVAEVGEAEGRKGRIVKEISQGYSVDFVTRPGAGGAIVSIFESAPGAARLPEPDGLKEAANLGEWLESRLHLTLTQIADDLFGDGHVNREERKALSAAIGQALDSYHTFLADNAPDLFARQRWQDAPASDGLPAPVSESAQDQETAHEPAGADAPARIVEADDMSEVTELQESLATAQQQLREQQAATARLQEQIILRDARDFVAAQLAETDLPDVTQTRLVRQLAANPPVADGALDVAALGARVQEAVTAAEAEVTAILGATGQIRGQGGQPETAAPSLEEAERRTQAALAEMGYGPRGGSNG